tara:strand:- start:216971 stop:218176 length:1206 start_codon:yes stop_codon:yes gene_type:complete
MTKHAPALEAAALQLSRDYCENGPLPHLQLFISVNGEVMLDRCFGRARAEGDPLQPDAIYRIASMTKPVATVAFLMLVEEGLVSLDTPLADILPEFRQVRIWTGGTDEKGALATAPCERPIMLIDLLRHTAGFSYSFHGATPIDQLYGERYLDSFHQRRTGREYAAALAELPLQMTPGECFHYSLATDLLGVVIEQIAGMPLDRFLEARIFEPLGMSDSFFVVPAGREDRLTDAWQWDGKGLPTLYDRGAHSRWRVEQKFYSAGGGLLSTVQDYHRFLRMLMQGGELDGERLVSREHVALMLSNHLPGGGDLEEEGAAPVSETSQPGIGMGLGGAVILDPARALATGSVGTYFWGGLLSTGFFLDPPRQIIAIVMTQLMPSGMTNLREDFRRCVYAALRQN